MVMLTTRRSSPGCNRDQPDSDVGATVAERLGTGVGRNVATGVRLGMDVGIAVRVAAGVTLGAVGVVLR